MNKPEALELPSGWNFQPLNGHPTLMLLTDPTGRAEEGTSWHRKDAQAFADAMQPKPTIAVDLGIEDMSIVDGKRVSTPSAMEAAEAIGKLFLETQKTNIIVWNKPEAAAIIQRLVDANNVSWGKRVEADDALHHRIMRIASEANLFERGQTLNADNSLDRIEQALKAQQPTVLESDEEVAKSFIDNLPLEDGTEPVNDAVTRLAALLARHRTAHTDARVKGLIAEVRYLQDLLMLWRDENNTHANHMQDIADHCCSDGAKNILRDAALETNESQKS